MHFGYKENFDAPGNKVLASPAYYGSDLTAQSSRLAEVSGRSYSLELITSSRFS